MIVAATVERFRGIQRLEVDGFGRVNLIIGKNDCGKTALMEAVWIADAPGAAAEAAAAQQRRLPLVPVVDFNRFWLPMFWKHDASAGFSISTRSANGSREKLTFRKAAATGELLAVDATRGAIPAWALDVETTVKDGVSVAQIVATAGSVRVPPVSKDPVSTVSWVSPSNNLSSRDIQMFSMLKQTGRDLQILELLRRVDDRASGIELLSPTGSAAEVFVRVAPDMPLLPLAIMGDGFQRSFEIGVAAAGLDGPGPMVFIDELDNGLHHSALEPIWQWLAGISRDRGLQVFATTHSEECIHAAARAFAALDDDGLRVIRLDRREDRTTAAVYDRALVETAAETGIEIRG